MKQKKIWLAVMGVLITSSFLITGISHAVNPSDYYNILTHDDKQIVDSQNIDHPLIDGAYETAGRVDGIYIKSGRIGSFLDAKNAALAYAQNIINWTLALVGTVALVYLLYTGFQMLTAAGDETKFKGWTKKLRSAVIAVLGIAMSAIFVNFILYVIDQIVVK